MNPYERLLRRIGRTRAFAWFGRRVLTPLDTRLAGRRYSLTTFGTGFPVCYLTTTGRRSGAPRTVPLLYVEHEDGIALAATNFGGKQHPGWSFNLEADPTARVAIREQERVMTARRASDGEIARLWPRFCDIWPAYDAYRDRTTRDVKVFLLDPRP